MKLELLIYYFLFKRVCNIVKKNKNQFKKFMMRDKKNISINFIIFYYV